MSKHFFHIALVLVMALLISFSLFFKDSTEAMIAVVDSQVTAVSFQNPVIVKKVNVIPGQEVKKGDLLLEVVYPDLDLDIKKYETEIDKLNLEIRSREEDYLSRRNLERIELGRETYQLESEINELKLEIEQGARLKAGLSQLSSTSSIVSDTLKQLKIKELENRLSSLKSIHRDDNLRRKQQLDKAREILEKEIDLVQQRLTAAKSSEAELVKYAQFTGTVGAVNVQLNELIPPFKSLITIYEAQPSLIKAYMNEAISYEVSAGQPVWVESENRNYRVAGEVIEIGSRITSFPTKLEPDVTSKSYGQEVFVKITSDNRFLNGEKVYVYPQEDP